MISEPSSSHPDVGLLKIVPLVIPLHTPKMSCPGVQEVLHNTQVKHMKRIFLICSWTIHITGVLGLIRIQTQGPFHHLSTWVSLGFRHKIHFSNDYFLTIDPYDSAFPQTPHIEEAQCTGLPRFIIVQSKNINIFPLTE